MSRAFTYFNSLASDIMLGQLTQALNRNVVAENATGFKTPAIKLPPDFDARLKNIKNWWNLDRSEAARRSYIDAFVYEAMNASKARRLIVTAEETVPENNTRLGHGSIDYLVADIDRDTSAPIHNPSVIIEAKKATTFLPNSPPNGENQLLAEMATLWQIKQTQQGFIHGVLSDGRFWKFYEINASSGLFLLTNVYDTEADVTAPIALLSKFFELYDANTSLLM